MNPFAKTLKELPGLGKYYSLQALNDPRIVRLPYCIRILLESAIRNCDEFEVKSSDVEAVLDWKKTSQTPTEVPFKPARVLLQDFTGVPCIVDLAAMRDAMKNLGGNPKKINPLVPVDLVIDHSIQVDYSRTKEALEKNQEKEFARNSERFAFLKWGAEAFSNMLIVPPGSGIVHQVNLEYLARSVLASSDGILYPDSVVGTDSHTTMIDALGVVGWGVGGIEAEAVMLGQPVSMLLPEVVGFKLIGRLSEEATATDLVLTITEMLRKRGVVGKFVEFFGKGVQGLSLADRATISNMSPEYGATMGYFPVDKETIAYLKQTARDPGRLAMIEEYMTEQRLYNTHTDEDPDYSGDLMTLDLTTVEPCLAGPKRPHDRVRMADMKTDFTHSLTAPVSFKGYGLPSASGSTTFDFKGKKYPLSHGSVVIAAITSCTNTSNPSVMMGAGMLAKNALAKGLSVAPYIKTSLSPGSGVVAQYLEKSGLMPHLEDLGFYNAGYGCMTCIGNSGDLDVEVANAITSNELVAAAVLSGNRNFEGRVHPQTRANYLASPMLVVAYALAGTMNIDFDTEPVGYDLTGKPVMLKEIWPARGEIAALESTHVLPELFRACYESVKLGTKRWNDLAPPKGDLFQWDEKSTYIHNPPYFKDMTIQPKPIKPVKDAYCLALLADSITTDHISPAGKIAKSSPAAEYLMARGVDVADFNSYGARRGNDEVMARGTFANIRLLNNMVPKAGPTTLYVPTDTEMPIWNAAEKYMGANLDTIVIAGSEYGAGSSRDWAAKGPLLQGVRAVIAVSYERIHRSNLIGMGIVPFVFKEGESAATLGLTGKERYTIAGINSDTLKVNDEIEVTTACGKSFKVKSRIDTEVELEYVKHGGILQYVLRKLLKKGK